MKLFKFVGALNICYRFFRLAEKPFEQLHLLLILYDIENVTHNYVSRFRHILTFLDLFNEKPLTRQIIFKSFE